MQRKTMSMSNPEMRIPAERPSRPILGAAAVLLPTDGHGQVHWADFTSHLVRTVESGLIPAVNMDTGYVHLIDEAVEDNVLSRTQSLWTDRSNGGSDDWRFIAGVVIRDRSGDAFDYDTHARRMETIQQMGGIPIVFPSHGLNTGSEEAIGERFDRLAEGCDRFLAFELGQMFVDCGRVYSLELFRRLLEIPACLGLKHSSLERAPEWERLELRDRHRPDFRLLTGNDLAIDMVKYGSDYLLGLATLAPDLFALRDRCWLSGDAGFYTLNDWLQYLGCFCFRDPVPAYRHSAAQWLKIRGWIESDEPYPGCPRRPDSDRLVLQTLWDQVQGQLARLGLGK